MLDLFIDWAADSTHWTARFFRFCLMAVFCILCIVVVILMTAFGDDNYHEELRAFRKGGGFTS